jgi:DNA replication protein DnaC
VPAALIATLAKGAWVAAGQPCCLVGDSGTGKSHLLIGLGTAAAENGYRVRYVTAAARRSAPGSLAQAVQPLY